VGPPEATRVVAPSPVGPLGIEARAGAITRITFHASDPPAPATLDDVLVDACRQLDEYFEGRRRTFALPLAPEGTAFQRLVWRALTEIAYGQTLSYGQLAQRIGRPAAVRAVGAANGQNPIPIVIPCHRVIGADGRLVGFGGGLDVKRYLLGLECGSLF
jgi:methylated-DNA-[protein]-cysteine S-methyltransferase